MCWKNSRHLFRWDEFKFATIKRLFTFSNGDVIFIYSAYASRAGEMWALHSNCHTMPLKWCGIPFRTNSCREIALRFIYVQWKRFFLSLPNVNIKLASLWTYLETLSPSFPLQITTWNSLMFTAVLCESYIVHYKRNLKEAYYSPLRFIHTDRLGHRPTPIQSGLSWTVCKFTHKRFLHWQCEYMAFVSVLLSGVGVNTPLGSTHTSNNGSESKQKQKINDKH